MSKVGIVCFFLALLCGALPLGCVPQAQPSPDPGLRQGTADRKSITEVVQPGAKGDPKADVVAAWEKAGFKAGWIEPSVTGSPTFALQSDHPQRLFAFRASRDTAGQLAKLPPPDRPFGLAFGSVSVTNESLKGLDRFRNLEALVLPSYCKVDNAGLKELAGLKRLRILELSSSQVSGPGLEHLAGLTRLEYLGLAFLYLKGEGLQHLAGLQELRVLLLHNSSVGPAGAKHLAGLKQLRVLTLVQSGLRDAGLAELAGLTELERLDLLGAEVSDAGLKHLGGMTNLRHLSLSQTFISDAGLKELASLKKLETLHLRHDVITDAGVKHLAGLTELRHLDLLATQVSQAAVDDLKKALPKAHVAR
jgi:hypothetical protein